MLVSLRHVRACRFQLTHCLDSCLAHWSCKSSPIAASVSVALSFEPFFCPSNSLLSVGLICPVLEHRSTHAFAPFASGPHQLELGLAGLQMPRCVLPLGLYCSRADGSCSKSLKKGGVVMRECFD